jgi:hypothetical protein
MIDQEKIVDDIMLDELEKKVPGCKEYINNTDNKKKRLGMLSVLGSNYNRDYFEGYRSLIEKEKVCAEYISDIVYTLRNYIGVADTQVKTHGEVMTPLWLVEKMLDTLPKHVWKNKRLKWLDPANGVGTFPSAIVKRLMEGLKEEIPDSCERYQHIVENMIYVVEIQSKNMFLYHCAFDIDNTHKLKTFYGSFLSKEFDEHMKNVWGVDKFDIIIGNPPYQRLKDTDKNKTSKNPKTQPLWHLFVQKNVNNLIDGGYMVVVHPGGWRDIRGGFKETQDILKSKKILELHMFPFKSGLEVFDSKTNFDYYILKNEGNDGCITEIHCENGSIERLNLLELDYIPGENIIYINSLFAKENDVRVELLSNSTYHTQQGQKSGIISKLMTDKFNLPVVYMVSYKDMPTFTYSNIKRFYGEHKGHFGFSKIIWAQGSSGVIIDKDGEFGMSEFSAAIFDTPDNLENIKKAIKSEKFIKEVMLFKNGLGNKYNNKVISMLKKDFWKEFI